MSNVLQTIVSYFVCVCILVVSGRRVIQFLLPHLAYMERNVHFSHVIFLTFYETIPVINSGSETLSDLPKVIQ